MSRYIPNTTPLPRVADPRAELEATLTLLIKDAPPSTSTRKWSLHGLYDGPTSIAYLFYAISRTHPRLRIQGHSMRSWAKSYLAVSYALASDSNLARHGKGVDNDHCGIANEILARCAVTAVVEGDLDKVDELINVSKVLLEKDGSDEWLYGRAGYLYLLRVVRKWLKRVGEGYPHHEEGVEERKMHGVVLHLEEKICERILQSDFPWVWHGKAYLGAVHGAIGIVTQLVLSQPVLAQSPQLVTVIDQVLNLQISSTGNWPSSLPSNHDSHSYAVSKETKYHLERTKGQYVQLCHGAPGFVTSLLSLRPFLLPNLFNKVDAAIREGRECIWERGILIKESCLCHGLAGNALSLEQDRFERMMAFGTEAVIVKLEEDAREGGRSGGFEASDSPFGLWTGMAGRAWAWAVMDSGNERCLLGYNDC